MKSKIFSIILSTVSAFAFTFGLSACGGHKHEYGELKTVKSATCTEAGEGVRICSICGEEESVILDPLGHDLQTISGKEPTCIDEGFTEYEVCLRVGCDYNTKRIIPATGVHVFDEDGFCIYCKTEKTRLYFEMSEDGTYAIFTSIVGGDGAEFEIPSEYNGVPVTEIGAYAFIDSTVTKVIIPDSVTVIGEYAFSGSTVAEVVIPNSVTVIEEYAFSNCGITDIVLPYGITEIAAHTFSSSSVTEVTIPDSVTAIGDFAFERTPVVSIVIPDSVTEIGDGAFADCGYLTTIILPDNLQKFGVAFEHNDNLIYNRDERGSGNFLGSENNPLLVLMKADTDAESFDIDANTRFIYGEAFKECELLTSLEIPDSVLDIGAYTFEACENLESVTLPQNLDKIPASMFLGCTNLVEIKYFDGETQQTKDGLPGGIREIGDSAFAYSGIESIEIPYNVTTIFDSAFEGSKLKEVSFINNDNNCTSIGSNAFAYCSQLEYIVLPEYLTEIQFYTFNGCGNLEWVYIPAGMQTIGEYAFGDCSKLNHVYFGGITETNWNDVTLGRFVWGSRGSNSDFSEIVYLLYSAPEYVKGGRYWWWNGAYPAEWLG